MAIKYSDADKEKLRAWRLDGVCLKEIAARLGYTYSQTKALAHRMGFRAVHNGVGVKVWFPSAVKDKLAAEARRHSRSVSEHIRQIVQRDLGL